MRGTLFQFFDVAASGYFVLLLTGFLFATAAGTAWARRIGQDPDVVVDLGLAALLLGIIGGKLLHVLADGMLADYVNMCLDPTKVNMKVERAVCASQEGVWDAAKGYCHPSQTDCFRWAKFWTPGYAYYGGLIFASIGSWFLLKRDKFPFWRAADMAGFAIPIGLGFGRMGCLLAGCCFGSPTAPGFMSLQFPPGSAASKAQFESVPQLLKTARMWSAPVHPTQIWEAAGSLAIAAVCLFYIHGRKKYDGEVFVWFIGLYAALRFVLEFYRADDRGSAAGLSTSQLIGLALIAVAYLLHRRLSPKGTMPGLAAADAS